MSVRIENLYLYPVKSLGGIEVTDAILTGQGLAGDREWMIVNEQGQFVTQRQLPKLATIQPILTAEGLLLTSHNGGSHEVTLNTLGKAISVRVWKHNCQAFVAHPNTNQWLTSAVNSPTPLQLVRFDSSHQRPTDTERFGPHHTLFADAAPYLFASTASLNALNKKLIDQGSAPVTMQHFRPNIVISGIPAFAEHKTQTLTDGNQITFQFIDHCQRCAVITINPNTGEKHPKQIPFKALAEINPMPNTPAAPAFGVNAVMLQGAGLTIHKFDMLQEN